MGRPRRAAGGLGVAVCWLGALTFTAAGAAAAAAADLPWTFALRETAPAAVVLKEVLRGRHRLVHLDQPVVQLPSIGCLWVRL